VVVLMVMVMLMVVVMMMLPLNACLFIHPREIRAVGLCRVTGWLCVL